MITEDLIDEIFGDADQMKTDRKYFRYKLQKQYYMHVKSRPMIDKMMLPKRKKIWDTSQMAFPKEQRKPSPKSGFHAKYTFEELRIINTPIDELMQSFEKTL